ncbi:C-C motif chemokine 20 [Echeneis naucrates]|uniref:C-C motif chemokine 20 n=1 Tax=Echeneis naucrates TaxID=173247 RepID=UPI0011146396|nr:C-C motif chemokine 20-like [Echeneis naucrates]
MTRLVVLVLGLLLVVLVEQSENSPMKVCCTQYQSKAISPAWIKYYIEQDVNFCDIRAVILVTLKNKLVCVNPDSLWLKPIIKTITKRRLQGNLYIE